MTILAQKDNVISIDNTVKSGMDKIVIQGGTALNGKIRISGAKNAALPLMTAALLTEETLSLGNIPHLADITTMSKVLAELGVEVSLNGTNGDTTLDLTTQTITNTTAHYDLVRKMRASIYVLGPLVARCGEGKVSLPGGCAIGARPVDMHIDGLKQLGAEITLEDGYVIAKAPNGLTGADIIFPKVSVGATGNIMMAATLAKGTTVLKNAAREPDIADLGNCLNKMGAKITGHGTETITIEGVDKLHGAAHDVMPDRIETGTFAIAAAMTGGKVTLTHCDPEHLTTPLDKLRLAGVEVHATEDTITITRDPSQPIKAVDVMTEPFPGFPTDLQAQMMTLLCISDGAGMVTETIFENRFMHVPELSRMGADITIHTASALVRGVPKLKGAEVMATDLRASVSLVLAGLVAEGQTTVSRIYHLDRGYERLVEKLSGCGADLTRIHT